MKARIAGLLGAAALTAGLGLATAPATWASSTGCAFSNGCATLHGTDANSNAVAMDAKYQKKTEILIGYPDNVGDNATSFDGVLHYTHGRTVRSYSDTGLSAFTNSPVITENPTTGFDGTAITSGTSSVNTGLMTIDVAGGSGPYTFSLSGLAGAKYNVVYNWGGTYPGLPVTNTGPPASATNFVANEAQITVSVNGDNLAPGVYNNVSLTITDSAVHPTSVTYLGAVRVYGNKAIIPGSVRDYYTFVYAAHGVWSNQCVTDTNGSGALRLETCTLGHNTGQDFTIDSTSGLLDGNQHHVSNLLAAAVNAGHSCLTDPSTSNAATPQSDAADEQAPGGRQLYVNGSCAVNVNQWSWGT